MQGRSCERRDYDIWRRSLFLAAIRLLVISAAWVAADAADAKMPTHSIV